MPVHRNDAIKLIDISATLEGETNLAFYLDIGTNTVWVPKSQVENNKDGTFTMPEWLAREKGII